MLVIRGLLHAILPLAQHQTLAEKVVKTYSPPPHAQVSHISYKRAYQIDIGHFSLNCCSNVLL